MNWRLLFIHILCINFKAETHSRSESYTGGQELLLCRKCGSDVADSSYLINKSSPGATKTESKQLFGKQNITIQTLINPFGNQFEVITIEKARCHNIGSPQAADSWFPEHSWKLCLCPRCGQHLGWTFEALSRPTSAHDVHKFHGLILSNVLGENFTDSLMMAPKTFYM